MKIYLASAEPKNLQLVEETLLSFYDLTMSNIPFRKITFKILKDANTKRSTIKSSGNS